MAHPEVENRGEYIIPARTLRGSRSEMIADIDQAIVGLLALRRVIDDEAPASEPLDGARRRRRGPRSRWRRQLAAVMPAVIVRWYENRLTAAIPVEF